MRKLLALAFSALCVFSPITQAMNDTELKAIVEQRLLGDRSGACFAVAVIEKTVSRATVCANPKDVKRISAQSAFEIGSVTKTMTSALLADLILQGKASLDDPLASYLPAGTFVPMFEGKPILLKHLVTHTSGLPVVPDFSTAKSADNPYAEIDDASLLKTLSGAKLLRAPGAQYEYSNYAMMLLSSLIAKRAGVDFETLLQTRLFAPVGMPNSYINQKPKTVLAAQGHTPNHQPTSAWNFSTNAAGVGGVRATLDDMVAYVSAQLGLSQSAISPALKLTQQEIKLAANTKMAMNWSLAPLDNHWVHIHEGGTGGFSSFVAFDLQTQRGVVVLSDTAMTSVGGLSSVGNHLLDERLPLGKAHKIAIPSAELLRAIIGQYEFSPGMQMTLTENAGRLFVQATGQQAFEMGYDDNGDFYPLAFDAVLRAKQRTDGGYLLVFMQGGGAVPLRKIEIGALAKPVVASLSAEQLAEYSGMYPLMPNFALKVFAENGQLMAQASGQGAFALDSAGKDVFSASAFGIEIRFTRGEDGKVSGLRLLQAGNEMKGSKQPGL